MKADLPDSVRSVLLRMPPYTPALIGLEGRKETALVMRVENLSPFRRQGIPITVRLVAGRSSSGTWVVAIAFRVVDRPEDPLEGDAYLNPRQAADHELLVRLSRQEIFPFVFLSVDLREAVGKRVSWSLQQRAEVGNVVVLIDQTLTSEKLSGSLDPEFARAKEEFQRRYSVGDLLG